jgi:hypothetical protein
MDLIANGTDPKNLVAIEGNVEVGSRFVFFPSFALSLEP